MKNIPVSKSKFEMRMLESVKSENAATALYGMPRKSRRIVFSEIAREFFKFRKTQAVTYHYAPSAPTVVAKSGVVTCHRKRGFTLIELSIILVVIGFLAGGILVGSSLIESSRIRAQIAIIEEYKAAVNTFKLKYNAMPGDIAPTQAAQLGFFTFTGTYAGQSFTWIANPTVGSWRHAFGNNSGDIEPGEGLAFWKHLSEAKLIAGQYGGTVGGANYLLDNANNSYNAGAPAYPTPNQSDMDIFMPQSRLSHTDNHTQIIANRKFTQRSYFDSSLPNFFLFYVTPYQESVIDTKLDDGLPDKGIVRDYGTTTVNPQTNEPCRTYSYGVQTTYDLAPATASTRDFCRLAFLW